MHEIRSYFLRQKVSLIILIIDATLNMVPILKMHLPAHFKRALRGSHILLEN
jgi:hypothetical protein